MIGQRTRYSLAQLLEQQEPPLVAVLFGKHGARVALQHDQMLCGILNTVRGMDDRAVLGVLAEVVGTAGDLRARIAPKYRFDERLHDLEQCLALDGYAIQGKRLVHTDPSIVDAPPIDDDLIEALQTCAAPRKADIVQKINDSAQAFRASPPDYNASLVNARVAMETLASDIALDIASPGQPPFDPPKWGEVLGYLRKSGEVTVEEEQGLAGVFRFLSPRARRPVAIPEVQMARLGRSFALNMCWFLLQNHLQGRSSLAQP